MNRHDSHRHITEPASRGLRLLFCCCICLLLAACASSRPPQPEPVPLTDRTADTDYDLSAIAVKLEQARDLEHQGNRALAEVAVNTAAKMLAAGQVRERRYLQVVKAAVWARQGEGRDAAKARELLESVRAESTGDGRLLADVHLADVVLRLADGDNVGAARAGDHALRALAGVQAHARSVEAARDLAFQFLDAGDLTAARSFARRAESDARRLGDDKLLVQTCLDVARIELHAGGDPEPPLKSAYEATYRLNDLGWRNVVITVAVDGYFSRGDNALCVLWGDRLRNREEARLPALEMSGLYPEDYISLLGQYALAAEAVETGSVRGTEARRLALAEIRALPAEQRAEWRRLEEKLASGLLNPEGKK